MLKVSFRLLETMVSERFVSGNHGSERRKHHFSELKCAIFMLVLKTARWICG